jgi:hypothetical protein
MTVYYTNVLYTQFYSYDALHGGCGEMDNIVLLRFATILQDEMWRNYIAKLKKWRNYIGKLKNAKVAKVKNAKKWRNSRSGESQKCQKLSKVKKERNSKMLQS